MLCFGFRSNAKEACRDNFHVALVAAFAALYEWPWVMAITLDDVAAYDALLHHLCFKLKYGVLFIIELLLGSVA